MSTMLKVPHYIVSFIPLHFVTLISKYSPQDPVPTHPQRMFRSDQRPSFTPILTYSMVQDII
jgi:hypothetical protein